jgi:hypothetical protein
LGLLIGILSARAIDFGSLISNRGIAVIKVKEAKIKEKKDAQSTPALPSPCLPEEKEVLGMSNQLIIKFVS